MKIILLFILTCLTKLAVSQNFNLKFWKYQDNSGFAVDVSYFRNSIKMHSDDTLIILKDGIHLKEYKIFKKVIQNTPIDQYNTLKFLVGYNLNNMYMVFDNNHNNNFSDDSVYKYTPQKRQISNKEFRNSLPLIQLDSLEIINEAKKKCYYSTQIKFCPTLKTNKTYSLYYETPKNDKIGLLVFSDSSYHTDRFNINNVTYHIEIIPHPFIFPVYPIPNSNFSRASFALIKHITNDSLVMVGSSIIEIMLTNNRELVLGNLKFKILKYDFNAKQIEFTLNKDIKESKETISFLNTHKSLSMDDLQFKPLVNFTKKYIIIEFGGSWCKPCVEMLPELNRFYKKLNNNFNLISILKEPNDSIAKNYYVKSKFSWKVFFEPLLCPEAKCLSSFFDIGVYPTVLLLNKKGELLFRTNGSGAIEQLEKYLKENALLN